MTNTMKQRIYYAMETVWVFVLLVATVCLPIIPILLVLWAIKVLFF